VTISRPFGGGPGPRAKLITVNWPETAATEIVRVLRNLREVSRRARGPLARLLEGKAQNRVGESLPGIIPPAVSRRVVFVSYHISFPFFLFNLPSCLAFSLSRRYRLAVYGVAAKLTSRDRLTVYRFNFVVESDSVSVTYTALPLLYRAIVFIAFPSCCESKSNV